MKYGKNRRIEEAKERQAAYNKLTVSEKIAKLDKLFGKGKGAIKERIKLAKKLQPVIIVEIPTEIETKITEAVKKPKRKAKVRRKEDKEVKHKNKE